MSTSRTREYEAGVPVLVNFRWNFRLDLPRMERALNLYLRQLVARWSVETNVAVFGYAFRTNHVHLILAQQRDGHDDARREGIAPMMRNVLSQLAIMANRAFGHEGRITERTYQSVNLPNLEDFLQRLSYIHHQDQHQQVRNPDPCCEDSRPVYRLEMDGIVTAIPLIDELCPGGTDEQRIAALVELLDRIGQEALALEEQARRAAANEVVLGGADVYACRRPWRTGTARALKGTPIVTEFEDPERVAKSVRVELLKPAEDKRFSICHRERRNAHLRWRRPTFVTPKLPPASVGQLLRVTVTTAG